MRLLPPDNAHGWTPYVWLVYAALFVAYPFAYGPGVFGWAPHVLGLAAFLALYFPGYWEAGRRRLGIAVALAVLGAALAPLNAGALMFFIYASSFVGEARTGRAAGVWIGGFTVAGVATAWLAGWSHPVILGSVAVFTPLIGFVNVAYALTKRQDASLRLAHAEIARLAAQAERHRIAGDVHDTLGQSLTLMVLKAELASKLLPRDREAAGREVLDIERMAREALTDVRRVVSGIRHASLAGEWRRAADVLTAAGVAVQRHPEAIDATITGPLGPGAEHALAMAVREAVTNVIRHARATECRLVFSRDRDRLTLEVVDNGVGGTFMDGHGLMGMRARLTTLGGSLECEGHNGTRLVATVPVVADGVTP
jgi:two-component system sensor histidine kinase DesK